MARCEAGSSSGWVGGGWQVARHEASSGVVRLDKGGPLAAGHPEAAGFAG